MTTVMSSNETPLHFPERGDTSDFVISPYHWDRCESSHVIMTLALNL